MKNIKTIIGCLIAVILILGIVLVAWPRMPRGEYTTERGIIYYFSDGVVAVDTTRTPHVFHIYAGHPDAKRIERAELIEDGIEITGPGLTEGAKDFLGATEVTVGYSGQTDPGKVRVVIDRGDFTESLQMAIDPQTIRKFVDRGDWNASVREIWEK